MPLVWNLRKWLAVNRDIYRPVDLQKLIAEKAGVHLSLQAVSALMQQNPSALRIATLEALCTALDCKASDFFDVLPLSQEEQRSKLRVAGDAPTPLYGAKKPEPPLESPFPDPYQSKGIRRSTSSSGNARKSKKGQQEKS
jgi:DNA-binding Xre family transcriptional regulator